MQNEAETIPIEEIVKKLQQELQATKTRLTLLEDEKAKDNGQSEACIIMIMQLEVAFLLVDKMFDNGLFKSFGFHKDDLGKNEKG